MRVGVEFVLVLAASGGVDVVNSDSKGIACIERVGRVHFVLTRG